MKKKEFMARLSSCTMAALITTTSIVPVSAAEVEFQDEASAEVAETPKLQKHLRKMQQQRRSTGSSWR